MTEQDMTDVIESIHEQAANDIYRTVRGGARWTNDLEAIFASALQSEKVAFQEYFMQLAEEAIVNRKWNAGKNFIESLEEALSRLRKKLEALFLALDWIEEEELARAAQQEYLKSMNNASKGILTTETTRIQTAVILGTCAYYRYDCCNDSIACPYCLDVDNKEFDTYDAQIGRNLPPMHTGCRCRIIPL